MYELPARRWRRCVVSAFSDITSFGLFVVALVLIVAGITTGTRTAVYVAVAAAVYLFVFEVRSYTMRLEVDSSGVVVSNRFSRYRIPWNDVVEIHSRDRMGNYDVGRVLEISRRGGFWKRVIPVTVYASFGMDSAARQQAARDLMTLARRYGTQSVDPRTDQADSPIA